MPNFRFSAIQYLNDWFKDDRQFVTGLRAPDRAARLRSLVAAATYYKVIRSFRTIDERNRLGRALTELEQSPPITAANVDWEVPDLSRRLAGIYGQNVVSAASKFLWLRFKSPVVIFDDRARRTLGRLANKRLNADYAIYRATWREQFAIHDVNIRQACDRVVRVKAFSLGAAETGASLKRLVSRRWFRERVFDKFLWLNAPE